MSKTFGQLLDQYIASELKPGQAISSAYLYMEDYQTPKMVLNTAEDSYDYTEILFRVVDLSEVEKEARAEIERLQAKIRQLEKSKKEVSKAIALITKHAAPK